MNSSNFAWRLLSIVTAFLITSAISSVTWAAIYYIDATMGNNQNNGLSPSTAWEYISKINSSIFNPGDTILFKRGNIWNEQSYGPVSGNS